RVSKDAEYESGRDTDSPAQYETDYCTLHGVSSSAANMRLGLPVNRMAKRAPDKPESLARQCNTIASPSPFCSEPQ
ncbi:MAG: hypothetical protein OEQ18_12825, partial [Gammaproteobacteria bacterium]|nr:hypothetical protein [Gammaproteobacteria bacterium]